MLAAVLSLVALALTACGGSGGGGSDQAGPGSGTGTTGTPAPGKYQTLPEPCGSVSPNTLRALLPASGDYAGSPMLTYDTDRRVGCRWTGTSQGANRDLSIDFERVVSYAPTVSDDDDAAQDFARLASAAHIPDNSPDPSDTASIPSPGESASPPPAGTADTSPRRVGGIGDEAYLDDALLTTDGNVHRDVTVVFRTANVLVTIDFSEWADSRAEPPSSFELQLGAHGLAQELAERIAS